MTVDSNIKKKADDIRNKTYGSEVRESLASGIEEMSSDVMETISRQMQLDSQFQTVIDETTGKDIISAPEIIAARNGKTDLSSRLNTDYNVLNNKITTETNSVRSDLLEVNTGIRTELDDLINQTDGIKDWIIEQGENYKGWWEKWASGKLVQYGALLTTHPPATEAWGSIYVSNPVKIEYPIPFWDVYTTDVTLRMIDRNAGWLTQYDTTTYNTLTETPRYALARPEPGGFTTNVQYDFIAIGRWKEPDGWEG